MQWNEMLIECNTTTRVWNEYVELICEIIERRKECNGMKCLLNPIQE